ncbi:MAG: hypothetical protein COA88_15695 [Kordia sp.]|nr:MAG: hypothetical protein COA88_15695 [Kordia sp.]
MLVTVSLSFGQAGKTRKMLAEIEGEWKTDKNNSPLYEVVIEDTGLSAKEMKESVLSYLKNTENITMSLREVNENDVFFTGKMNNIHSVTEKSLFADTFYIDTYYNVVCYFKDDRLKIKLTTDYYHYSKWSVTKIKFLTNDQFPINPNQDRKNIFGKTFYKSHKEANNLLKYFQKEFLTSEVVKKEVTEDW